MAERPSRSPMSPKTPSREHNRPPPLCIHGRVNGNTPPRVTWEELDLSPERQQLPAWVAETFRKQREEPGTPPGVQRARRAAADKAAVEQRASDKAGAEQEAAEKVAAEQAATRQAVAGKAAEEQDAAASTAGRTDVELAAWSDLREEEQIGERKISTDEYGVDIDVLEDEDEDAIGSKPTSEGNPRSQVPKKRAFVEISAGDATGGKGKERATGPVKTTSEWGKVDIMNESSKRRKEGAGGRV